MIFVWSRFDSRIELDSITAASGPTWTNGYPIRDVVSDPPERTSQNEGELHHVNPHAVAGSSSRQSPTEKWFYTWASPQVR